ncbi:hypothetical protein Tco_0977768 [Tanacetum coccineum]|uniref:Uncharacterized protein n=1 Tax=Tanacetum coccineum TaxID=301880 RepID=A0ABQ5EL26_9ASTR
MEDLEQAFVEYTSSCTDEAGGKWNTFKLEQNDLGDTYNPSWRSHPNLRWRQPQNSQNNFSNPPKRFQPNDSIPIRSSTTILEVLTINQTLKDCDTVKNLKLSTYPVLSARSYPTKDSQCSTQTHGLINAITIHTEQQIASYDDGEKENKEEEDDPENFYVNPPTPPDLSITFITEKVLRFNSFFESLGLVPPSSNTELICTKVEDGDVMFIEIVPKDDNSRKEEPKAGEQEMEYFDIFRNRSKLAYHKLYLMRRSLEVLRKFHWMNLEG